MKKESSLDGFKLYAVPTQTSLPDFKHHAIKKFSHEKKKAFLASLREIELEFIAVSQIEKSIPDNKKIKTTLESIHNHLMKIRLLIGDGINFSMILGSVTNVTGNETDNINDFLTALPVVENLTAQTLKSAYQLNSPKTDIPRGLAKTTYNLLVKYELKPTLSKNGIWESVIKHIANNCGLPIKDVRNDMRKINKV